jgi:hypothetical protein
MPEPDQPLQIFVGGANRHTTHRNILALVPAALGDGKAQGARRSLGILKEKLVKVAQTVEQQ